MKLAAVRVCAIAMTLGLAACGAQANPAARMPQVTPHFERPQDTYGGPTGLSLNVLLGDAAPNLGGITLKQLDLGIREIDAIENGQTTVLASYNRPRVVNVLAHQDDDGESIADANVAQSTYQQIRLVVDLASSKAVFSGWRTAPVDFLVNVASASTVGAGSTTVTTTDGPGAVDLVVTQPFSIPQNRPQSARVDFNAFESLALDPSGALLARATLFVAPIDDMGHVTGRVLNAQGIPVSNATVAAVAPDGSIGNTGWTNDRGRFTIGTLRAGTYQLMLYNDYTTAAGREIEASRQTSASQSITGPTITITAGQRTAAGTIAD